jgi:hypothetical protein
MGKLDSMPHLAATPISAPWVVEIAYDAEKHNDLDHMDAVGVFVSDRHVVTSAHTFRNGRSIPLEDKQYFVRSGSEKIGQGDRRKIERTIVHPDFKPIVAGRPRPKGRNCDLAVIVLSESADVKPVTLAEGRPLTFYSPVSVLGWPLGGDGTGNLHQVNTAVLPYSCGAAGAVVPGEFVVANFVGPGQMEGGYSGGPVLVFPEDDGGEPQLVGVMSRGAKGMPTDVTFGPPGIAADLAHHRAWLNETVRSEH